MINIETKCKDCQTPIKLDGIITTPTAIDFSEANIPECPRCGCKWTSVRVIKEEIPMTDKSSNTVSRYFIDTEFIEHDKLIDLISIGIVSDDGRELYLQSVEFDIDKADYWIEKNVLNNLVQCPINHKCGVGADLRYHAATHGECGSGRTGVFTCPWRSLHHMRSEVLAFIDPIKHEKVEIHAWCGGYDFVIFCQLFGKMTNLPGGYPHYFRDFQQILDDRNILDDQLPEQEGTTHNALEDARHLKQLWGYIVRNDAWQ